MVQKPLCSALFRNVYESVFVSVWRFVSARVTLFANLQSINTE